MRYYKIIEDGYIPMIGTGSGGTEITQSEYENIKNALYAMPVPPDGYAYRLKEDLSWEAYELPAEDISHEEITSDELMGMIEEVL